MAALTEKEKRELDATRRENGIKAKFQVQISQPVKTL